MFNFQMPSNVAIPFLNLKVTLKQFLTCGPEDTYKNTKVSFIIANSQRQFKYPVSEKCTHELCYIM